ncbi:MAG: LPS assembly lipoprotein LptE [Vicinamibacteria bacterium]
MRSPAAATGAACVLLSLAGCGYSLVGKGITLDPSIKRIGVPVFKDDTGTAELDQKITQKVIVELLKRGHFDVVQDTTGVDAIVEGEILSYRSIPIGFTQQGSGATASTQASRYAVVLTARVRYKKVGALEPIWETSSLQVRDETDVGDSSTTFFERDDQVVERLSTSFARTVVAAMLEAF